MILNELDTCLVIYGVIIGADFEPGIYFAQKLLLRLREAKKLEKVRCIVIAEMSQRKSPYHA